MPLGWGQTREVTVVNDETERGIPLRTFWNSIGVWVLIVVMAFLSLYMVARQIHNLLHPQRVRWYRFPWLSQALTVLLTIWPTIIILIALGVIILALILLYRFQVETAGKNAHPVTDKWDPNKGMWTPFVGMKQRKSRYREFFGNNRH